MTDIAKRNNRNRRAGNAWESNIRDQLRDLGYKVERTRNSGTHDEGDLAIFLSGGMELVIEAKNCQKFEPTKWVTEASEEAGHYAKRRRLSEDQVGWAAFSKRRGKGSVTEGFAILTIGEFLRLLELASTKS